MRILILTAALAAITLSLATSSHATYCTTTCYTVGNGYRVCNTTCG